MLFILKGRGEYSCSLSSQLKAHLHRYQPEPCRQGCQRTIRRHQAKLVLLEGFRLRKRNHVLRQVVVLNRGVRSLGNRIALREFEVARLGAVERIRPPVLWVVKERG